MSLHYDGHTPPAGTPLLQIALFLADGLPVFPCNAAKRPITSNGLHDASQDRDTVNEMFARPKAALIGVPTGRRSGVFAVDIDVRDGAKGGEWLAANEYRLPQTRRHRTQSGGTHLLFAMPAGRAIRNSAGKLADNVDVRGDGGYIIYPPSTGYSVSDPAAPAEAPDWLLDLLDPPQAAPAPASKPRALADDTNGSRYALAALSNACDAIMGAGWGAQETTLNNMALHMGHFVAGGELSKGYAREALISAGMGMRNQPGMAPWHERDIRAKVERAMADGEARPWNAPPREVRHVHRIEIVAPEPPPYEDVPHHWHGEPDYDMSLDAAERFTPAAKAPTKALHWTDEGWDEAAIERRQWAVPGHLLRGAITLAGGPGGTGKSSLMVAWACAAALGEHYGNFKPNRQLKVMTYNVEDDENEQRRRFSAALRQFGKYPRDLAGRVARVSPDDIGTLIQVDRQAGTFLFTQAWDELEALIQEWQPDILMLDPLAELHTAEENDNTAMRHVVAHLRTMARRYNIAIILIHHTRKGAEAGDLDSFRGASATGGAIRKAFTVTPMDEADAAKLGISDDQRWVFFKVADAKNNYGRREDAAWHQMQEYELDNGEHVAAALPWAPPNTARQGIDPDVYAHIMAGISHGTAYGPWSPRLSMEEPRSVAVLFHRHGISEPKAQKSLIKQVLLDGCTVQEFLDTNRIRRKGLRAVDGLPAARWCTEDAAGAQSGAEGDQHG